MTQQRIDHLVGELKAVKPGDPVLAAQWNKIVDAIGQLVALMRASSDEKKWADVFIGELLEDAAADTEDFEVQELYHDENSGGLTTTNTIWDKTFEPQVGLWLEGERLAFFWDRSTARYMMWPGVQIHIGKMDAELAAGASAIMSVWEVDASGEYADSGKDIAVFDWLLKAGSVIAAGKKVIAVQFLQSRRFIVIAAECP